LMRFRAINKRTAQAPFKDALIAGRSEMVM
jgi:hypothetical protein